MSTNKVMLIGRLGRDPEMTYVPGRDGEDATPKVSISLATDRSVVGKDGQRRDVTDWHPVVAWGRTADALAQYTRRGTLIHVEGHLEHRSWDGEDGRKHYRTEVVAEDIRFLSRGIERDQEREQEGNGIER